MSTLASVTHILPLASIERIRNLPFKGEVLVRAGQEVSATDVIARTVLQPQHLLLDIARVLNVPEEEIGKYLERKIGEKLSQGAIIAVKEGTFTSREVRAPRDGKLVAISKGQALLEVSAKPFELLARIPGTVVSVEAERGAVIHANGAWIQGVWGNRKVESGSLFCMAKLRDYVMSKTDLALDKRGSIVYAGHCNHPKILDFATEIQVQGLILGSMPTQLIPKAQAMPFPIVVLEGFGNIPVNQAAHTLISTNEEREVTLNAEVFDRQKGERPEIIIPLPVASTVAAPRHIEAFRQGLKVRIIKAPFQGEVGEIESLPPETHEFPGGLRARTAKVFLESGDTALVPLANIEVLS